MDKRELYVAHKAPIAEANGHICACVGVSKEKIEEAIAGGAHSFAAVQKCTGAGGGCSLCEPIVQDLIAG